MRKRLVMLAALVASSALLACGGSQAPTDADPGDGAAEPVRLAVQDAPPLHVELADDTGERAQGLMGRDRLADDAGMLFVYDEAGPQWFWMKDTLIALDVLWIRDGRVTGIETMYPEPGVDDASLRRYDSPGPVDGVLEVNAGWARRHGVVAGAHVKLLD